MRELRLHADLYRRAAIDEAVALLAPHASIEVREALPYVVVRVSASSEARARRVALELANHALAGTIRAREPSA